MAQPGGCGVCRSCYPDKEPFAIGGEVVETMDEQAVDIGSAGLYEVQGVQKYNHGYIKECLARLCEAEATLAGVRSVLTKVVNQSSSSSDGNDEYRSSPSQPASSKLKVPEVSGSSAAKEDAGAAAADADIDAAAAAVRGEALESEDGQSPETCESNPELRTQPTTRLERAQAAMREQATNIAREQNISVDTVHKVFLLFESANKSGDGLLTVGELEMLLIDMCDGMVEDSQLHYIMNKFDADGDGALHFDEFIVAFVNTPLMKVAHISDELRNKSQECRQDMAQGQARLQAEDWVQMMGCKAISVKRYVNKEIQEASSCLSMPLVFAMFALYFLSVVLHLNYEALHATDKAISFDIKENANFAFGGDVPFENGRMGHKNIYDVNSFADFWSWLDLGIVPIFWAEGWELSEVRQNAYSRCMDSKEIFETYGYQRSQLPNVTKRAGMSITASATNSVNPYYCATETLPPRPKDFYNGDDKGIYLYYHSVVAGVRLRQERGIAKECPAVDGDMLKSVFNGKCVPASGYDLKPERQTSFGVAPDLTNRPGGETTYLQSRKSQGQIRKELHALEDSLWLSPETAKVEVLFTLYNPHLDIFSAVFVIVFMNRGGHMYKMVEPVSTLMTGYSNPATYVVDILLTILILKILVGEGFEVLRDIRLKGFRIGVSEYLSPSNFVDWASVIYFFILVFFWVSHLQQLSELRDVLKPADTKTIGSFPNIADRDAFYDLVDTWVKADTTLRTVMAIFPFIIGARFFKVFALQPRLGVVTATLRLSFVDIIHFFTVFCAIFLVFVTTAMIIFGQEIEDFTNFGRCTMTVFQIMMGDYDSEHMIQVARHKASVWYWAFTWLVNLIMLNMLLAIIMDVYTEVKGKISADSETMWSQVVEIVKRWNEVRQGRQIPMEVILDAMEHKHPSNHEAKEEQRLTLSAFMEICPNMPEHQAMRILCNTYTNDEFAADGQGCSQSEMSTRVGHIFKNTQILHSSIERLIHMQEMSAEMMSNHFAAQRSHSHHQVQTRDAKLGIKKSVSRKAP